MSFNKSKIRRIYNFFFPKKYTPEEIFELRLTRNPVVNDFTKVNEDLYLLTLNSNLQIYLRGYTHSDLAVLHQIFNNSEYRSVLSMIQLNETGTSPVIIDGGANVGYTSLYFSQHLSQSIIIAIEPSPENAAICQANFKINKNSNNIKLYEKVLHSETDKSFSLKKNFRDNRDWAITAEPDEIGKARSVSLNSLIKDNNLTYITLLKLDIEGAERFIFQHDVDLSFLKFTKVIAVEIHDEFNIRNSIVTLLIQNNFFLFESGELTIGVNKKYY